MFQSDLQPSCDSPVRGQRDQDRDEAKEGRGPVEVARFAEVLVHRCAVECGNTGENVTSEAVAARCAILSAGSFASRTHEAE